MLDHAAIARRLEDLQAHFAALNAGLDEPRDPLVDTVLSNMLEGYALIDRLVAEGEDIFRLSRIGLLLEINTTVLCGTDRARRWEYRDHIEATEERFYANAEGGMGELLEWYAQHRGESAWKRAAGTFVRILSTPQLFIEGNHRSGSLILSYLLMRDGLPPFVLTADNAPAYFNPASVIRKTPRHGARALFQLPKIKKRFAAFLEAQSDPGFLLDAGQPKVRRAREFD